VNDDLVSKVEQFHICFDWLLTGHQDFNPSLTSLHSLFESTPINTHQSFTNFHSISYFLLLFSSTMFHSWPFIQRFLLFLSMVVWMVKGSRSANLHPLFECKFALFGSKVSHMSLLLPIDLVYPSSPFFLRMGEVKNIITSYFPPSIFFYYNFLIFLKKLN
jgi:hypothetical protein